MIWIKHSRARLLLQSELFGEFLMLLAVLELGVFNTSVGMGVPGGILAAGMLPAWLPCHWEPRGAWHGIKSPGIFHHAAMPVQEPGLGDKTVWWDNVMVKKPKSFLWSLLLLPTMSLKGGDFPTQGKCRHIAHYRQQKGVKRRDREEVKKEKRY